MEKKKAIYNMARKSKKERKNGKTESKNKNR
jgi:hypothetical protein